MHGLQERLFTPYPISAPHAEHPHLSQYRTPPSLPQYDTAHSHPIAVPRIALRIRRACESVPRIALRMRDANMGTGQYTAPSVVQVSTGHYTGEV
eukprot:1473961-Rhodomonas_salina.1